jgi:DinB family protein
MRYCEIMLNTITAPEASEYASYYDRYISLVKGADIVAALEQQAKETIKLFSSLSENDGDFRYAPDKWSIKEMLGHISDGERIMSYRVLRFARNDRTPIEGFEQDDYIQYGPFQHCRLADLIEEFGIIRKATLALCRDLDEAAWMRRGIANKNEISVTALVYVIAGHELHHRNVLNEKYLPLLKP